MYSKIPIYLGGYLEIYLFLSYTFQNKGQLWMHVFQAAKFHTQTLPKNYSPFSKNSKLVCHVGMLYFSFEIFHMAW